jgi:hypothetical protein
MTILYVTIGFRSFQVPFKTGLTVCMASARQLYLHVCGDQLEAFVA